MEGMFRRENFCATLRMLDEPVFSLSDNSKSALVRHACLLRILDGTLRLASPQPTSGRR